MSRASERPSGTTASTEALSDFDVNPYFDLRTGTLFSKVGARSAEVLKERENTFVNLRIAELKGSPVQGKLDFTHLKEIHHRLFQDVCDWAGKARQDFDAAKQDYHTPSRGLLRSRPKENESSTSWSHTIICGD